MPHDSHPDLDPEIRALISNTLPPGYWVAVQLEGGTPKIIASGETELEARLMAHRNGVRGALILRVPDS